jgi:urease accessory protein
LAHVEPGGTGGLLAGLSHPISGLDHVLAMLAVGLWGAQLGSPAVWLLPITFPMVMALGGMLGLVGIALPAVELGIAVSALVLGLAVAASWRPSLAVAAVVVALFAMLHGHAHGTELAAGLSPLLYSVGFVVATGTLHALGIAVGLLHRYDCGKPLLRVAGALVTAGGLYCVWRALV